MLRPFYRGLPIIVAVMAVCVMAEKKYLNYVTPMYESVSKIKLADAAFGIAHSNLYRNLDVFASSSKIAAEVEMVKSEVVVSKALERLDLNQTVYRLGDFHKTELYNDRPFTIRVASYDSRVCDSLYLLTVSRDSVLEIITPGKKRVVGAFNHLIKLPGMDVFITKNDSLLKQKPALPLNDRYEFMLNSRARLVKKICKDIDVMFLDKEVPILRIAYTTPVAQQSADIVNAVSEAYIADYIGEKYAAADTTVNFLDKEVKKYSVKLNETENDIESFRKQHNVINIKQETETNLKQLSELENHLSGLQMDLVAIDSLDQYIRNGRGNFIELAPNFQTFNDLLSTEMVKKIKSLQADKRDLLLRYTPENEKVKVIDDKLTDMYTYLQESIANTRTNLQLKYNDLATTIRNAEAAFASFPSKDRNMTVLERNFNLNDQNYRFLREKKTDAEIARAASLSFHRIITSAEVAAKPVSPNTGLLKVVAGFLGFMGGTFLIYLVHMLKDRVNDDITIQKNSDTPIFAAVPFLRKAQQAESIFEKIAVDLYVKKQLEPGAILTISSYGSLEGKRTIAAGLANAISAMGKTTILLDADGRLAEAGPRHIKTQSLAALCPNWKQPKALQEALSLLQSTYEVIIIKNAAIESNSAALLLMGQAGFNLLIADTRRTKLKRVGETDLLREKTGLQNIQFIINRDGYTPTIFSQMLAAVKKLAAAIKQRRAAAVLTSKKTGND